MSVKRITTNAILSALLFTIYLVFSQILYLEFVTFTIVLYALNLPRKDAVAVVSTFVILVWAVYGVSPWSLMYLVVYGGFAWLLSIMAKWLNSNDYRVAGAGFVVALLAGNLIDLPMLLISKEVTIAYIVLGLKTTLVQGTIAFSALLLMYRLIQKNLVYLIKKGNIYEKL
jgi:hypothetical protein